MSKTITGLECTLRVLNSQLTSTNRNIETMQKEMEKEKSAVREIMRRMKEAEDELAKKTQPKKAMDREILDYEAPRSGEKWSEIEYEMFLDRLKGFIYDCAIKSGRSTLAIKYKMADYCAGYIPSRKWGEIMNRRLEG